MIIVLIDQREPWIDYILEQFIKINLLLTPLGILSYNEHKNRPNKNDGDKELIIEYGKQQIYPASLFIPKKNEFKTDDYLWLNENLPIFRGTVINTNKGYEYDILYNAFVHLSRLEEWQVSPTKNFNAYSFNHPRKNKRIWKIPVVNYLFNELEKVITAQFPSVVFGRRVNPVIEFSHDVDYLEKTIQLRIKQSAFYLLNSVRSCIHGKLKKSFQHVLNGVQFLFTNSNYWCFDQWTELEKKLNIQSIYYIYCAVKDNRRHNFKRWLIDPSYNISNNKKLREKCKELMMNGIRIGLHGSYYSGTDEKLFKEEKEILENIINCSITKSRIHWLNYNDDVTPRIFEETGIQEDSSISYNEISGFRAGIASRYNPYDHTNRRAYNFYEVPLVIMDSQLYDYSIDVAELGLGWFYDMLAAIKNCVISIDWHQRVIHKDYGWDGGYLQIAEKIKRF